MSIAIRAASALAVLLASLTVSNAGTDTASLNISATVVTDCRIAVGTLTFANYTSGQSAPADAVGNLGYSGCANANLKVELNGGANNQTSARGMKSPAGAILRYQLYQNSARSTTVGTGTGAISLKAPSAGSGTIPIYGRILPSQSVAPGNYADTVGVTLTF